MPIQCDIVTQERSVFSGEVDYVSLPGTEGRMGILPKHAAMLTALSFGEIMVRMSDQEQHFAVGGGYAEVQPDKVVVLADSAEQADEIDLERAEAARARAAKAMKEGVPDDPMRYAQVEAALPGHKSALTSVCAGVGAGCASTPALWEVKKNKGN